MSILGSSSDLFVLDGQGAIFSSSDLYVNGWLRASGLAELYGGVTTAQLISSMCRTGELVVNGAGLVTGTPTGSTIILNGQGLNLEAGVLALNSSGVDTGVGRGLRYWDHGSTEFALYMATPGAGKSSSGGVACSGGLAGTNTSFTSYAVRNRMSANPSRGWIWENAAEELAMSVRSDGHAYVRQSLAVGGGGIDCQGPLTINGVAAVAPGDLDVYLTKSQYQTDNLTEILKEAAQAAWNAATETSIDGLEATTQILGTSLIAGTFTLGGQLIENVDAAFLNLDGRLISVSNAVTLKADIANLALKADTLSVNSALALKADASALMTTNNEVALRATALSVNTSLSLKASLSGAAFTGIVSTPSIPNIQASILALQASSGGGTTVSITECTPRIDGWDITTNNTTSITPILVTPAGNSGYPSDNTDLATLIDNTTGAANTSWIEEEKIGFWEATSSALAAGSLPFHAFDNNLTTVFQTAAGTFNTTTGLATGLCYVQLKFPVQVKLATIRLYTHATVNTMSASDFNIQGSNDNVNFTTVQSYVIAAVPPIGSTSSPASSHNVLSQSIIYMYWRVVFTKKFTGGLDSIHYRKIEFFGRKYVLPHVNSFFVQSLTLNTFAIRLFTRAPIRDAPDFRLDVRNPAYFSNKTPKWWFHIVLLKNNAVVNSGLYQLARTDTVGVGALTLITDSAQLVPNTTF